MSVTDPYITEIKGWTAKLLINHQASGFIDESDKNLIPFCQSLENILSKGLSVQYNALGFAKEPDAWHWLEKLANEKHESLTFAFTHVIGTIKRNPTVATSDGILRLLIRTCLVNKCMHVPVQYLQQTGKLSTIYKRHSSIIGDDILIQIFLSVLLQCSKFNFKLDLTNSSFLDYSWLMPKIFTMELVPCKALGLSVSFVRGKAIIINIKSNSVASDEGVIEIGDILDNLNGIHICGVTKGKLKTIMTKQCGRPVNVRIIKAKYSKDGSELYPPIVQLLKLAKIDPDILRLKYTQQSNKEEKEQITNKNKPKSPGYQVTYLGNVETGSHGDTKQIEKAVKILFAPLNSTSENKQLMKCERFKKQVCFELGEIGIKIVEPECNEVILNHSYMEIASCGTITNLPHYFAYIAGEESCNVAKNFTCYLFHSKIDNDVFTILQSMGQGFHRTNFAV